MFNAVAASVLGAASLWLWGLYSTEAHLASVLAAGCYSCIEFTWIANSTEHPDGSVSFTPGAASCRKGHTTWAQFWANVVYLPVALFTFRAALPLPPVVRFVMWPLNIWGLEIVEGYAITWLCGRNIAWVYTNREAACSGNVNLAYWPHWLALGAVLEVGGGLDGLCGLVARAAGAVGGGPDAARLLLCALLCAAAVATPVPCVVERASRLLAAPGRVWRRCLTAEGVNDELGPWVAMSVPRGGGGGGDAMIDAAAVTARLRESGGAPVFLCRSVVSLWLLPLDVDFITIAEFDDAARRFVERSPMLSMRGRWCHERTVAALAAGEARGACVVHDRLSFTPRLGLMAPLLWAFVFLLFRHRHARLAAHWGSGGGGGGGGGGGEDGARATT